MKFLLPFTLLLALVPVPSFARSYARPAVAQAASAASALSDVAIIRSRYLASLLPTESAARETLRAASAKDAARLRPDGSWADIDYTASDRAIWVTCDHLERVAVMAQATRLARDAGHPDEALVRKTLLALKWWTDHDYKNPNWWWNEIHVPQLMGEIGNLLAPQIPADEVAKMVMIMKRSDWEHGPKHTWSGANLSDSVAIQIARGCIENNAETVAQAFNRMYEEIRVVTPPEQGIQPDDSFHQHGNQLYNGGYGMGFAVDSVRLVLLAQGTQFHIPPDRIAILVNYLLDGQQWIMWGARVDYNTMGRGITRETKLLTARRRSSSRNGMGGMIAQLAEGDVPQKKELQAFAERLNGTPGTPPLIGNRQFWYSDFMVHRRAGYDTSVKMLSTRMQNGELVNSEGKKSVHLSDGANYLYLTGDEYTNVFVGWDWTHIPGTTAIQGTLETGEPNPITAHGTTTFDGGVSDGKYGLAAMALARGQLTASKAWFFFDKAYVALGAGITLMGDSEHGVATDVNQPLLKGEVLTNQSGGPIPVGTHTYDASRPVWIYHNHVGYVLPAHTKLSLFTGPRTGKWSDIGAGSSEPTTVPVFDLWIDHGHSPLNATYQYIVLPGVSPDQIAERARSTNLDVLSNTASIQAVYNKALKLVEIAFRQPGTLATPLGPVEVDHSCLLMVSPAAGGGWKVSASNPENQPLTLHVSLKGKSFTMELPMGEMAGSTKTAVYR